MFLACGHALMPMEVFLMLNFIQNTDEEPFKLEASGENGNAKSVIFTFNLYENVFRFLLFHTPNT